MKEKKQYTVGSLYAGVGGICLGFQMAGAKLLWANEFDKFACITYRNNFSHNLYEGDVWKIDENSLDKVDILCAGFPCQPFSVAGKQLGFNDERGNHFFRIVDIIKATEPKAVFLENVKNLYSHDNGKTYKVISETLSNLGYTVDSIVLNSKDYGNVPQNRERIYIVCFKSLEDKKNFCFPDSIDRTVDIEDILESKVSDNYHYEGKFLYDKIKNDVVKSNTAYQWRRKYVRENMSGVSPTLTANMGTGGHNVPIVKTENGIRKLTPRECFRLQGFPDNYVLPDIADSHLYKQAGNSVTVTVIERIAKNMINAMNGIDCYDRTFGLALF
jgi:DNA (cytosine-5)-methyltransferase 1